MSNSSTYTQLPATRTLVILLFCLTVGVRVLTIAATFKGNDRVLFWEDVSIARNLVRGNGYALDNEWRSRMVYGNLLPDIEQRIQKSDNAGARPTTLKQPLFPFVAAAVFYLFGIGNFLALFVVQAVLAGLTAVMLFLAVRLYSQPIGLTLAVGFALYPPFIYQCATSPESTIVLLLLLSIFLYQMVKLRENPTIRKFAIAGAIAGTLGLTNPAPFIFTTAALCLAAFIFCDDYANRFKHAIAAGAVMAVVIAPWFVRNYVVFDRFFMRASTGHELLKSRAEAGYPMPLSEETLLDLEKRGRRLNELEEGEMLRGAIKPAIAAGTMDSGRLILMNLSHFWWEPPRYRDDYSLSYMAGRRIPYYMLLILSIPAVVSWLIQAARRGVRYLTDYWIHCLAILLIACDTAVYAGAWGAWNIRYHYPVELALMLFAAEAFVVCLAWLGRPLIAARRTNP